LTLRTPAPGPWMVTLLATVRGAPGVMVPLRPGANTMVSPGAAAASTAASEPAPLGLRFRTVPTAGVQRSSRLSTLGRARRGRRVLGTAREGTFLFMVILQSVRLRFSRKVQSRKQNRVDRCGRGPAALAETRGDGPGGLPGDLPVRRHICWG